jgi:hypothetical protein
MIFPDLFAKEVESAFSVCPLRYDSLEETQKTGCHMVFGAIKIIRDILPTSKMGSTKTKIRKSVLHLHKKVKLG